MEEWEVVTVSQCLYFFLLNFESLLEPTLHYPSTSRCHTELFSILCYFQHTLILLPGKFVSHQTLSVPTDGVLNGHFASMDATITHITIWQSASYIFVLSGLTDKFFIVFFFIVLQRELF